MEREAQMAQIGLQLLNQTNIQGDQLPAAVEYRNWLMSKARPQAVPSQDGLPLEVGENTG